MWILSENTVVPQRVKIGPWEEDVKNFISFMILNSTLVHKHICGVSMVLNLIMGPKGENS